MIDFTGKHLAQQQGQALLSPCLAAGGCLQDHDIFKKRLGADGKPINHIGDKHKVGPEIRDPDANETVGCGSCYGAQSPEQECCNTCDEVLKTFSVSHETSSGACSEL